MDNTLNHYVELQKQVVCAIYHLCKNLKYTKQYYILLMDKRIGSKSI